MIASPTWHIRAACRHADASLFFGRDGEGALAKRRREQNAAAICAGCPVVAQCGDWAYEHAPDGIWAGLNEEQRARECRNRPRRQQVAS